MNQRLGTHAFRGAWLPAAKAKIPVSAESVSVGIFEWMPAGQRGDRIKRGRVKVRVHGAPGAHAQIESKAREIVAQLDAGTYAGPKNIAI